jgi:AcrR family transcriptional regulator
VPAMPAPGPPPMRERYRAHVRHEVKQAALRQLAESGPAAVSISAIGKQLGMSGPALYRYFASRDELLTELTIDAYHDLADALGAVAGRAPDRGAHARLEEVGRAYRSWALSQPHRYRLLFGPPLPGYDAHAHRLVEAARASMAVLIEVLRGPGDPASLSPGPSLASQLSAWAHKHGLEADPATALRAVLAWSRLHGFVSLEIAGNYASMSIDPDQVFEIELATLTA